MDFARKQLEKYGWTSGKGLGKNENGISEALKPKLKRSVTGVGHDLASDFTEHWWNDLYNKAAQNVEVEEVNGKVKKIKRKVETFEITNNTWKIKKKKKGSNEQYADYFVRTAILSNGASKIENINTLESEEDEFSMDIVKMTDEELFAACEGRTAHKGARHGLKALGKLARIEQQEQMLLNEAKYNGYSNKSKQNASLETENTDLQEKTKNFCHFDPVPSIKKKKNRFISEIDSVDTTAVCVDQVNADNEQRKPKLHKKKKDKRKFNQKDLDSENYTSKDVENEVPKKKKLPIDDASIICETDVLDSQVEGKEMQDLKKKKKDKKKHDLELSIKSNISNDIERNISKKKKSFHIESITSETHEENIINKQKDADILIKKRKQKGKNVQKK